MKDEKYKIDFYNKLHSLYILYEQVKKSIILTENFDESQEMYIAPMNQLRSAIDHIFKAVACIEKDYDYELKEVKEHLERAGCDALDLLASNISTSIIQKLSQYDTDTLAKVFPDYFIQIKPKITEIRQCVANYRMERKTDSEKSFLSYLKDIEELIYINNTVDIKIPSAQEYKNKKEKENRKERYWKYLIGPIIGFISAGAITLLAYILNK